MKIETRPQQTQKSDEKFMKDSSHQDHAHELVKRDVGELKEMGLTKEEIVDKMAFKGFLKTDTDRKILDSVIKQQRVREDPELYRKRTEAKARSQAEIDYFIRQSDETNCREMEEARRRPKKYF
uniref:Uncharacterized protein n=1 Tax=viral metagenome TaxID=1070528 RepID=A0A6H2A1P7_9ZZZZ